MSYINCCDLPEQVQTWMEWKTYDWLMCRRYYPAEIWIKGITQRQIVSLIENKSLDRVYKIMQDCEKHNISILTQNNPEYPERAKEPEDSPIILYYKGCIQNQNMKKTVGIVGPRRCTQEEKHKVVEITEQYVSDNTAIVSGMAKGIDSYAHTACLKSGGYTVAVLGNGLDICYPCEHRKLMERIEENDKYMQQKVNGSKKFCIF